jgi:BirA family transcriptional regulator, biotin operon repressor / biotin---[acetyl-CoA-carboxylase] ligase
MTLRWPAEAIWEAISPQWPSFSVEILPEIDSTNSELMRRARQGQCDPVLLVAERQTAGRGRLGRDWHSDLRGGGETLTFSLGVPLAPADWSGLSLAVGLGVVQALHADLQLKWPNDVWWQQRKLAGILIETASVGATRYAVIGVGINIAPRSPEGLRTPPAWLQELWRDATATDALLRVAPALARAVQGFDQQGFAPLRAAFHGRDCLYGLAVVTSDGSQGMARGVDASGALLVHTDQGLIKISSAEVSVRPAADGLPVTLT